MSKSELNNLEAYRVNYQSIYHNQLNSIALSINLLEFGYFQFKSTYKYQHLEKLKDICDAENRLSIASMDVEGFLMNSLIDDVKISICFENLLKAHLLSNYYLVHELDKNIFPELSITQKERPIRFTELLELTEWKIDDKIDCIDPTVKNKIRGIKQKTLNYTLFLNNKNYSNVHEMNQNVVDILNTINRRRNELHLQSALQFRIANSTYKDFIALKAFLENNVSRLKNEFSNHLGIEDADRTPTLKISRT